MIGPEGTRPDEGTPEGDPPDGGKQPDGSILLGVLT
jgi:hypothetical protein